MTALVSTRPVVQARAYSGHWIVDCPRCRGAASVAFGTPAWECGYCGLAVEVEWPSEQMRRGIERLLMMRPIPYTRNWLPGETLTDLLAENIEHGIGPSEPGQEMAIVGDQITTDSLPRPKRRLQIGA